MSNLPRYSSLQDYLRVIRAHRALIVIVALLFAVAGYLVANQQDPVYSARSTLTFTPANSDTSLFEGTSVPNGAGDTRPAVTAQEIKGRALAVRVKKELKTKEPVSRLQGAVSARTTTPTNLVQISTRWGDADFAAKLANAYARAVQRSEASKRRRTLRQASQSLRRRFRRSKSTNPVTRASFEDRISQLEALSGFSSPVDIVKLASPAGSPVSPKPVLTTLVGLLVGLTVGILAAFLRDILDRRLRGTREIQEHMGSPVLGHLSEDALGRIPRGGTDRSLSHQDMEAFRILRSNVDLHFEPAPAVLAVTSGLPEEGKSTVAMAFASISATAGKSTALVDCDLRRPSVASRLGIAPQTPGLVDYLSGLKDVRDVIREVPLGLGAALPARANGGEPRRQIETVSCVSAGSPAPNAAELLGSQRFRDFIAELRGMFDLVVLDTAPLLSVVDTRELVQMVDAALLCVRASQTTREQATAAADALGNFAGRPYGLVATGLRASEEDYYGYYSYSHAYAAG